MGRCIYLALTLCAGTFFFSSAVTTLNGLLPTTDVQRLARAVENETLLRLSMNERMEVFDADRGINLDVLKRIAESPSMRTAVDGCLEDASRAALEIRLGILDQAILSEASDLEIRTLVTAAYSAVAQRLYCAPTDGNAWMLRAQLLARQGGDVAMIGKLLDLSYFYAPAEKWIIIPRLRLVGDLIDTGRISAPSQYGLDLDRVIGTSAPQQVATLYVSAGERSRRLMRVVIDMQRLDRRVQVLRYIDALGVSYPVAAACRSLVSNGPPGAELELRHPADLVAACTR